MNVNTNAPRTTTDIYQPIHSPNTGWVCPKCQRVHAPSVKMCLCAGAKVPPEYFKGETYSSTNALPLQVLNEG